MSLYPRVRALARILYREEAHIGHSAQNEVWAARVVLRAGNAERERLCYYLTLSHYLKLLSRSWSPREANDKLDPWNGTEQQSECSMLRHKDLGSSVEI